MAGTNLFIHSPISTVQKLKSLGMDKLYHNTFHPTYKNLSMLALKWTHMSKRGPRDHFMLKHVTSHLDSGKTAYVTAPLLETVPWFMYRQQCLNRFGHFSCAQLTVFGPEGGMRMGIVKEHSASKRKEVYSFKT